MVDDCGIGKRKRVHRSKRFGWAQARYCSPHIYRLRREGPRRLCVRTFKVTITWAFIESARSLCADVWALNLVECGHAAPCGQPIKVARRSIKTAALLPCSPLYFVPGGQSFSSWAFDYSSPTSFAPQHLYLTLSIICERK